MSKQYLTKERLEELKIELETLKNKKRVEVAERLKQAKEYGDLSENSEYAEAREEQANVETRIGELEDLLKEAVTINDESPLGKAFMKKKVGETVNVTTPSGAMVYEIMKIE